jgi:hypothetical protein
VKNPPWTDEQDELLSQKVRELGRRWQRIASFFDGRTDINVKNRWNHLLKIRKATSTSAPDAEGFEQVIARLFAEARHDLTDSAWGEGFGFDF